jgi:hypothetical protein
MNMRQFARFIWRFFKWSVAMVMAFLFLYLGISANVDNFSDAYANVAKHQAYRQNAISAIGVVRDLQTNIPQYSRRSVTQTPVLSIVGVKGESLPYRAEMLISSIYSRAELLPSWIGRKVDLECSPDLKSCRPTGNTQSDDDIFWENYSVFVAGMFGLIAIFGAVGFFFCVRKFKSYVLNDE